MPLCPNCGSAKHQRCCARCGALIRKHRRDTQYCTDRCEAAQEREDEASMLAEEEMTK